jgi:hypothetical protein
MRKRSRVRGGGRRDAMKKGTRMGSFPNPDGSERKRAGPIGLSMVAEEGFTWGRRNVRRDLKRAKFNP